MGLLKRLSVFLTLSSAVISAPSDLDRRAATIATTGVTGGVQPRLEIRTLAQNAAQWNIFLLGLAQFQAVGYTNPLSYYQIAGIHWANWGIYDGATACSGCSNGYCPHSMTLFPTWHRPYLALFEQQLVANAITAANKFTGSQKTTYLAAAKSLRLPYWDWAEDAPDVFPSFFTTSTIKVTTATGTKSIANPLYAYTFPSGAATLGGSIYQKTTVRYPSGTGGSVSQNSQVVSAMAGQQPGLKSSLWQLFTQQKTWDFFSTGNWFPAGGPSSYSNLESPHDDVHGTVGGGGHMSYLNYAAFDPAFWFHHAMVDRTFALWQALNPTVYFDTVTEPAGTIVIPANSLVSNQTALLPFHTDTTGDSWTTAGSWSTTSLGYTYPELQNGATVSSVTRAVTNLYSPNSTVKATKRADNSTSSKSYPEYIANVRADRKGLGDSFRVFIFDGAPDDSNPAAYINNTNLIASQGFLATLGRFGGPAMVSGATVSLTSSLQDSVSAGRLSSLGVNDVTSYLQSNIQWRITLIDGTRVPAGNVPELELSVVTAQVTPAPSTNQLPTWGPFSVLADITQGKAGGANSTAA